MKKPYIIALCGIDGSGKTNQAELLSKYLQENKYSSVITKAKMINYEILLKLSGKLFFDRYNYHPGIPPLLMNTVQACDVVHHFSQVEKNYSNYDFIICDRHKLCYSAYARAFDTPMHWVDNIYSLIHEPDLIFYFMIEPNIAYNRLQMREDKPIRTDENLMLLREAYKHYEKMLESKSNVIYVNAENSILATHHQIINSFGDYINLKYGIRLEMG